MSELERQAFEAAKTIIGNLKDAPKLSHRTDRSDEEFLKRLRENVFQHVRIYARDIAESCSTTETDALQALLETGKTISEMAKRFRQIESLTGDESDLEVWVHTNLYGIALSFGVDTEAKIGYFADQYANLGNMLASAASDRLLELAETD